LERLHAYWGIAKLRDYRLLFTGQAISQLGDWMNRVALLVLAYQITGQTIAGALLLLAQLLPRVIITPFGGVLADRYPKRRLMLLTDLLRAGLAASLIFVNSAATLWWAGVAVVLMHSLASIFNPARGAVLPGLVPEEKLGLANALNDMSGQTAFFIGPAIGGLIIAAWSVQAAFLLNAATFLLSALFIWLMHFREPVSRDVRRASVLADLHEGWSAVVRAPLLRFLCGALFLEAAVAIGLTVVLLPLLQNTLNGSEALLGPLMTCVGLGTLVGTLPSLWLINRFPLLPLAALATGGLLTTMLVIGLTSSIAIVGLALFVNGFLATCTELIALTTTQRLVPKERLGRAIGLLFWMLAVGQVCGALGASLLLRYSPASSVTLILWGACGAILIGLLIMTRLTKQAQVPEVALD